MQAPSPKPPGLRVFSRAYPGSVEQAGRVRADLAPVVDGCPVADEAILVASELCANASLHTASRDPGGRFTVRAEVHPGSHVRIEVEDQGGPWNMPGPDKERPHGLDIVHAVAGAGNWGIGGDSSSGHVVWVRLDWPVSK